MIRSNKKQAGIEDNGLYYTDHFLKRQVDNELESTLKRYNGLKMEFERVSKYKIESFNEFLSLLENPIEFYKGKHLATVEGSALFKQLQQLNLDTENLIRIPDGFDSIVQMVNLINRSGTIKADRYTIENNAIVPSAEFKDRMYSRVYFYATTPEQRERLSIAYSLIEAYKLIEPIIYQQLKRSRAEECIKQKLHFRHSLPYQLKAVNGPDGTVKIIPSPDWVSKGFEGTSFLGTLVLSQADIERAERDRQRIEASRPTRAPYETIYSDVSRALNQTININSL
jgi:hypothetical protein